MNLFNPLQLPGMYEFLEQFAGFGFFLADTTLGQGAHNRHTGSTRGHGAHY